MALPAWHLALNPLRFLIPQHHLPTHTLSPSTPPSSYQGTQDGPTWTINPTRLAPGKTYAITVTAVKGQGPMTRSSTATLDVARTASDSPTAVITRACGQQVCAAKQNPSEVLSLVAETVPRWDGD